MAGPFDATLKHLLEKYAIDWLRLFEISTTGDVHIVDANLATVSAEADKLLRIEGPAPWLVHLELQSSYAPDLPDRTLLYNVLAGYRHQCGVESIVLLLRRQADGPALTGELDRHTPLGRNHQFRYRLIRVWELPLDRLLENGVGTLPLAPLVVETDELARVVDVVYERVNAELDSKEAASLWTATYVLMGLRHERAVVQSLMERVRTMRESVTYQAILEEGLAEGVAKGLAEGRAKGLAEGRAEGISEGKMEAARELLLITASEHIGPPDAGIVEAIGRLSDYDRLKELTRKAVHCSSWKELFE